MLSDANGRLNHEKMDRLAMVLANLNNCGKQLLLVTSGAIALGTDKLGLKSQPMDFTDMQAVAAIGQAELMRVYQHSFGQYNQMVAQVLITSDVMQSDIRVKNTQNTFETLLEMNILPIINENDTVSTTDIELNDNYPVALNVAKISKADAILIKADANSKFIIQPRGNHIATMVSDENQLFEELDKIWLGLKNQPENEQEFPTKITDIVYAE